MAACPSSNPGEHFYNVISVVLNFMSSPPPSPIFPFAPVYATYPGAVARPTYPPTPFPATVVRVHIPKAYSRGCAQSRSAGAYGRKFCALCKFWGFFSIIRYPATRRPGAGNSLRFYAVRGKFACLCARDVHARRLQFSRPSDRRFRLVYLFIIVVVIIIVVVVVGFFPRPFVGDIREKYSRKIYA